MSANNTFNGRRFGLLFKQHLIQNNKMLIYSVVGYCGVVFLILSVGQLGNDFDPFGFKEFIPLMVTIVGIFGIVYTGYAFPAFRTKEKSFGYLTVPASTFEKMLFEFISRIVIALITLPLLFWLVFNLEGYFFELVSTADFSAVGLSDFSSADIGEVDQSFWLKVIISNATFLAFILAFTGAAMFSKQPLIKTLFSVAIIIMTFTMITYLIVEPMGMSKYELADSMLLIPQTEKASLRFVSGILIISNLVMLTVTYLKLKEKEV